MITKTTNARMAALDKAIISMVRDKNYLGHSSFAFWRHMLEEYYLR